MKKNLLWLLIFALLLALPVCAQVSNPGVRYVASAPSGACTQSPPVQVLNSSGAIYTCANGTWTAQGSGGTPSGPAGGDLAGTYPNPTVASLHVTSGNAANIVVGTTAEYSNGTCTTAATITPVNGNRQKITLTNGDTCALTFTQPSSGTISITLKVVQSSTSTFNGGISGCKWPGGTVPTITATSAAVDFVSIYLDGTNAYCVASQNFQ